jgi:hypothetical protein
MLYSHMAETTTQTHVRYRIDEMKADAAALGWNTATLIREARERAFARGESVPTRKSFHEFLAGKTWSPLAARKVAAALQKPLSDYVEIVGAARSRKREAA